MSSKNTFVAMTCVVLGLAACTPKETTSTADAGAPMASTSGVTMASSMPAPSGAPTMVTAAEDPLPSHSEVAKKVRGEITKQNYKTELDKLEKEVDQP